MMFMTGLIRMREDLGYQNLIKEETAQQAEEDSSSEEDEEDEKKKKHAKFVFSEVNKNWAPLSVLWTVTHNTTNIS
jgi:hypothetical protein